MIYCSITNTDKPVRKVYTQIQIPLNSLPGVGDKMVINYENNWGEYTVKGLYYSIIIEESNSKIDQVRIEIEKV